MKTEKKFDIEEAVKTLFPGTPTVEGAIAFIKERTRKHDDMQTTILKQLKKAILEYRNKIKEGEKRISVAVDEETAYNLKTPESVIKKIWRNNSKYTKDNFHETMKDIIRFRILCNYLRDVEEMAKILPGKMLSYNYQKIDGPKDFIKMDPGKRKKGHRAVHFVFKAVFNQQEFLLFEVQLMTLLQNAWNRKIHSIVYEPHRIGKEVPLKTLMRSCAMSDMLYVADDYFNELLLKKSRKKKR
jgi:ppGpp synthetase/RelA/SpoT-type nucleotidyltranferase